jgi:hypothetical protein
MRVFSTAIQGQLNRQYGSEPVILAEIEFVPGSPIAYSDRVLTGEPNIQPRILDVGNLDSTALVTLQSDSQSIDLVLDDTDGSLKNLIDANDISLGKVRFYLGFQGVPYSERALLMEGVIHSPIVYNDLSKSLSITVISKNANAETGFSMDDGDFPNIPEDQRGLQWPLVFGRVCNIQTLPLKPLFKGVLGEPLGAIDPTLQERLCQANKLQCPDVFTNEVRGQIEAAKVERDEKLLELNFGGDGGCIYIGFDPIYQRGGGTWTNSTDECLKRAFCLQKSPKTGALIDIPGCLTVRQQEVKAVEDAQKKIDEIIAARRKVYQACVDARQSQVCALLTQIEQQTPYAKSSVQIIGGEKFPQNTPVTIRIGEMKYDGTMSGTTFNITGTTHPDSLSIKNPTCKVIFQHVGIKAINSPYEIPATVAGCKEKTEVGEVVVGPGASWRYFQDFKGGRFLWMPSGSDVFLESTSKITHVVSLVPGIVTQVAAYRTFGDSKILTEVDPAEYEVNLTNYGDYQVTELQFDRNLSDIPDENWDDEMYVSFQSNFGPNPVNILRYLVETYTDYTCDPTSFDSVELSLANYPTSFVVRDRRGVFDLIKDLAYQVRCAATVRAGVVYLTYLSKEPTGLRTINEREILRSSFSVSTTPTEDIYTKHVINWQTTEAKIYANLDVKEKFILKHNVGRFGTNSVDRNYYTQNTYSTVEKSATFWMIRDANSWKYVEFETPLKHIDLDVYDCITVSHPGFPETKCVIQSLNVNFEENTIRFKCWTPILAGTSVPYQWAWPALQPAIGLFPGADYKDSGDGLGFTVKPPAGHPLSQGRGTETLRLPTDGDKNPSDLDDTYPANPCAQLIATGSEFSSDLEPLFAKFEAEDFSNFGNDLDERAGTPVVVAGGSGAGGGFGVQINNKGQTLDDCTIPDSTGCSFTVNVTYVNPDLIREECDKGPCLKNPKGPGFACSGNVQTACHVFSNAQAAETFRAQKQSEAEGNICSQSQGVWGIYAVSGVAQNKLSCPEQKVKDDREVGFKTDDAELDSALRGGASVLRGNASVLHGTNSVLHSN